jgi:hypothetical protein
MTNIKSLSYGIVIALVLAIVYLFGASATRVGASAPTGLMTTVAVATTTAVGPQQNIQIFAASNCNSRVISTVGSAVMITFADPSNGDVSSTTLSGVKGSVQAASTTVVYDSGLYGCDRWFAYAFASTTITTVSTR